jgi:hypothetical protein
MGGNATQLLKCGAKEVVMFTLPWALHVAFGQHVHAFLAS